MKNQSSFTHSLITFFLMLAGWHSSWCQVSVEASVDHSEITIGQRFVYSVKVTYPDSIQIQLPEIGVQLGAFEVKDFTDSSILKKGSHYLVQTFLLSTFTTGQYFIPPCFIGFKTSNGEQGVVIADKIEINVKKLSSDEEKNISGLMGQHLILRDPYWFWWLAGVLGIIFIIGTVIYLLNKKKKAEINSKKNVPEDIWALEAITQLKQSNLLENGQNKEYCFILSDIYRRYLGRRYGFFAVESTTHELLGQLVNLPISPTQKKWIEAFCNKTDMVKFADSILSLENGKVLATEVESFVY